MTLQMEISRRVPGVAPPCRLWASRSAFRVDAQPRYLHRRVFRGRRDWTGAQRIRGERRGDLGVQPVCEMLSVLRDLTTACVPLLLCGLLSVAERR